MDKPHSSSCDRNREPILAVLEDHCLHRRDLLELGSGTGQHAVFFATALPHPTWQASDRSENLPGIRAWLDEAALANTPQPLELDVNGSWPQQRFDAVFTANTLHIMAWPEVERLFAGLDGTLAGDAVKEVSRRARGTPRVALRLLRRVRDYAQVRADGKVTQAVAQEALDLLQVDPLGLDEVDRRVLRTIIEKYNGGPVGLNTIATSISEEQDTIMDVVEPYLLQLGFLDRTPQGRIATRAAYEHLQLPYSVEGQQRLLKG